ncbi:uncharacterized protein [Littorina saxatilis]|uniref:Uncharacterized protein n=1 Tax=Littorina saxatilis TaxID=31220 RepID=A0AAN9FVF7_9CAEN
MIQVFKVLVTSRLIVIVAARWAARLTCPSTFLQDSDNVIQFEVNSSETQRAKCDHTKFVAFEVVYRSGGLSRLCIVRFDPRPTCGDVTASNACGCVTHTGDIYTYHYILPGFLAYQGGRMSVLFCTDPQTPSTLDVSPSCNTIIYTEPSDTSSATGITEKTTTTTDKDNDSTDSGSSGHLGLIIGLTTGLVLLVAMGTGAVVWVKKKRSSGGQHVEVNARPDIPTPSCGQHVEVNARPDTLPPSPASAGPPAGTVVTATADHKPESTAGDSPGASEFSETSETSEMSETPDN